MIDHSSPAASLEGSPQRKVNYLRGGRRAMLSARYTSPAAAETLERPLACSQPPLDHEEDGEDARQREHHRQERHKREGHPQPPSSRGTCLIAFHPPIEPSHHTTHDLPRTPLLRTWVDRRVVLPQPPPTRRMALMVSSGEAILSSIPSAPASKACSGWACSPVKLITNTPALGLASRSSLMSSSPSPLGNPRSIIATSTPESFSRASLSEAAWATTTMSGGCSNKRTKTSRNWALFSTTSRRIIPLPSPRGSAQEVCQRRSTSRPSPLRSGTRRETPTRSRRGLRTETYSAF